MQAAGLSTGDWIAVAAIVISVVMALMGIVATVAIAVVGWLLKRSVESADKKLDELPKIREEIGELNTQIRVMEERVSHHAGKQDEFCGRLEKVEHSVLKMAARGMPAGA
jgi:hypothetical protein